MTFRRHHCRNCGDLVCNKCSPQQAVVYHVNQTKPKRICAKNCSYLLSYDRARTLTGIIYGDKGCGITSILCRLLFNTFKISPEHELFLQNGSVLIANDLKKQCINFRFRINMEVDKFVSLDCYIFVFDITNHNSYTSVQELIKKVEDKIKPILLIGNKEDLRDSRQVTTAEIEEFINPLNIKYFEVSAKDAHNVDITFLTHIIDSITKKSSSSQDSITYGDISEWVVKRKESQKDEELKKKNIYGRNNEKRKKTKKYVGKTQYDTLRKKKKRMN